MSDKPADVAAQAGDAVSKVAATVDEIKTKVVDFPVILVVLSVVAMLFAAYILFWVVRNEISAAKTYTIPATARNPMHCMTSTRLSGKDIPQLTNGKRVTIAFWMYISDFNTNQGQFRAVFSRGEPNSAINQSPGVFLAPDGHKLVVILPVSNVSADVAQKMAAITNQTDKTMFYANTYGVVLDGVPARRWVHVAVVVGDTPKGAYINCYLNGELHKTVNKRTNLQSFNAQTPVLGIDAMQTSVESDVYIGPTDNNEVGMDGYVSKISFTNGELNPKDIYNMYLEGPITSDPLAKAGYGIRPPLYRLG